MKLVASALAALLIAPAAEAASQKAKTIDVYERGHKVGTIKQRNGTATVCERGHKVRTYKVR